MELSCRIGRRGVLAGAAATVLLGAGRAQALAFDGSWVHQTFPRRKANDWRQQGRAVDLVSESGVSLLLREVPPEFARAGRARWLWRVDEGVPATDLSRKGGDDRNLALYFVFMRDAEAQRLRGAGPRRVMTARNARMLIYVWGGDGVPGRMLVSPYLGDRGRTVILRAAGTGMHAETVDLAADHARAFGSAPDVLFGLGLSADSDDTGSRIRARLSDVILES